jgi:choice-of-anchor B domain-containing protein
MKLGILFVLSLLTVNLFSQTTPYHNTKKQAQVPLVGGELSNLWGYTAPNNKEYAIVGTQTKTHIYDVSDCASPVLKASFTDGSITFWREYKTYKNFAYMVTEANGEGLEMFDMTDVNNITFSQRVTPANPDFFYKAHTLSIDTVNARMYISGGRPLSSSDANWLMIYQLSPTNIVPTLLKKIQLNTVSGAPSKTFYIHDLYVENNIIYCSHGPDGFGIWDCTDPNNIAFKGLLDSPGYNHSSWRHPFFPNYFYCAEETENQPMILYNVDATSSPLYSISSPKTFKDPLLAPSFLNNMYHNPHIKGNELHISAYHDGVQIYDISNPLKPIRAAYYDSYPSNINYSPLFLGAWGVYPFFNSGCICVSDINTGFHTFKTYFPKVEVQGNLHITEAGKGIVFRDSSNAYKLLTVSNTGTLMINPFTATQKEHKLDSADLELKTLGSGIILTSTNGTKYSLSVSTTGSIVVSSAITTPITNDLEINGHFIIDNKYKGIVIKSSNGQRWKINTRVSGVLEINKTAF